MSDSLLAAVRTHDTVILDGSAGEFVLGHTVVLKHLQNKTIIGTHDACLRTRFCLTKAIRAMLDSADVMSFSTGGEGGVLSNGQKVREQRELKTRQLFIDRFNDPEESFRASGCIQLSHCRDIIVRGLHLQGPGAIDVGGNDLLGMDHSMYITIDSCVFMDGMDGNLDITSQSHRTRQFLREAEQSGAVRNAADDLPKSFAVCRENGESVVYLSQMATATLARRIRE